MDSDEEFNKNKFAGNTAENKVEFLINSMPDWKCIKFGVENHIEALKKIARENINKTTKKIKSMPDFIAHNSKENKTYFIEVKLRNFIDKRNGKSEYLINFLDDLRENWKGTKLIILNPNVSPYFFVIDVNDVRSKMCRKKIVGMHKWDYYWDFKEIEKGIKDLFPNLKDEDIERALNL